MKYPRIKIVEPLVPHVDEDQTEILSTRLITFPDGLGNPVWAEPFIDVRHSSKKSFGLNKKAFYLTDDYDWVLGKDEYNSIVLVPLRKV